MRICRLPAAHVDGRHRGDESADREHELELLTLDAVCSAQPDQHGRGGEQGAHHHQDPAGQVQRVRRPEPARDAERVHHGRERLVERPRAKQVGHGE
jgi:hypothetical protein